MSEKLKPIENRELAEPTPRPSLLDVIKIDGRWAQVILGGDTVRYLDDKSETRINWDDYNCHFFDKYKKANKTNIWVKDLVEENQITKDEYETVVWGSINESPTEHNKVFVTVFGVYTRKK